MKINKFVKNHRYVITATLVAVFAVFGIAYLVSSNNAFLKESKANYSIFVDYNPFSQTVIEAESSYVIDAEENEVLYSKNAIKPLPIASITKIMTALVALEELPETSYVTIYPENLETEGESGLYPFEAWSLHDLVDFMLITSSNDAASALRTNTEEYISREGRKVHFTDLMNEKARELGLSDSTFHNATGLDLSTNQAGAYSSAKDVSRLFSFLIDNYPDLITSSASSSQMFQSLSGVRHQASNTNILTNSISDIVASKTGYTDLAGGNLSVVVEIDDTIKVITVLGSSLEGRFNDVLRLYEASKRYSNYKVKRVVLEEDINDILGKNDN